MPRWASSGAGNDRGKGRVCLGRAALSPAPLPATPGPEDLLAGSRWSSLTHRVTPDAWGWGGGC